MRAQIKIPTPRTCVLFMQFPETPDERQEISLEDLGALYTGYAFFLRPIARSDERAGPAEIDTGRDWFWANFKKNRTVYTEVGIAAFMINVFGLTSSIFIMAVYDRVVPNAAFYTPLCPDFRGGHRLYFLILYCAICGRIFLIMPGGGRM